MKLNISNTLLLTSFLSLLLTACGGGGTTKPLIDEGDKSFNNGTWVTKPLCVTDIDGSAEQTIIVTNTSFKMLVKMYQSANCSGVPALIELDYSLVYGTNKGYSSTVCNNINEIDLTLKIAKYESTVLSNTQIEQAGIPKKIYTLMCATTDRLYLGSDSENQQTRSTKINEAEFYTRLIKDTWEKDKFNSSSIYKNKCDNPRTGEVYADVKGTILDEKNWLRSLTNEDYLWYSEVEDRDPSGFLSPTDYFGVLKTFATTPSGTPKDKFHFSVDSEYLSQAQSGIEYGYGAELIMFSRFRPRDVRISYTQPNSPASNKNLIRGTRILEIDGVDFINGTNIDNEINAALYPKTIGEPHTFKVQEPNTGTIRTVTLNSAEVTLHPVQNVKTFTTSTGKVGYIQFNEHIATAELALINAITTLKNENIDDLILDLRYNGGGSLYIAAELASMIAGADATEGQVLGRLNFNDKHPSISIPFLTKTPSFTENPNIDLPNLDMTRVFVITGSNTCSASEALINSLRGVDLDVIQIGATTCGKPYGFNPEENCGTTYFSINFKTVNAKGFGDYADGFTPLNEVGGIGEKLSGCFAPDDLSHPLGDSSEKRLEMALYYQATGECATSARASQRSTKSLSLEGEMMKPQWSKNMTLH